MKTSKDMGSSAGRVGLLVAQLVLFRTAAGCPLDGDFNFNGINNGDTLLSVKRAAFIFKFRSFGARTEDCLEEVVAAPPQTDSLEYIISQETCPNLLINFISCFSVVSQSLLLLLHS